MGKLKRLERKRSATEAAIERMIQSSPTYNIPQEVYDISKYYQEGADILQKAGEEALALAKRRAVSDMPGYAEAKALSEQRTAEQLYEARKLGGTANLSQIYANQRLSDLQLAAQQANYKSMMLDNLQNMLLKRGTIGAEVANLRARGLGLIAQEKEKAYRYNELMPYQQQLQYQMQRYANLTAEIMGIRQARAMLRSSLRSGVATVAGAALTGAGAAGSIGKLLKTTG